MQRLLSICIGAMTQPFADGQPSSTLLVYFSGILGFTRESNSYLLAKHYTPALSGLLYIQRLLFLEYALPLQAYAYIGIAQRPRYNQLEQLDRMRRRYLVAGSQSAFDEMHELRYCGRNIARTEPPTFLLYWSDDGNILHYGDGFQLTLADFRRLPEHFISSAEYHCSKLMLNLTADVDFTKVKPREPLSPIYPPSLAVQCVLLRSGD